jgi:hypothetical protein
VGSQFTCIIPRIIVSGWLCAWMPRYFTLRNQAAFITHIPTSFSIAHLQVRTGVHAQSPVASAGAKNQVNWNPFPLPRILGERREARRTNALRPSCREAKVDRPTINEKHYILVSSLGPSVREMRRPIVHTRRSKVFSKADVGGHATLLKFPEDLKTKGPSNCQYGFD